ncbi:MAG: DUF484 family protein [Magnetococcales bacterium]|nr:DUF484 family protein [Magnetococcales bacterium]
MDPATHPPDDLTPEQVRHWLAANPRFFDLYPELLPAAISASGKVLSLEAGQLNALRRRNDQLSQDLDAMLERIRRNEGIYTAFHDIQVQLMTASAPWEMLMAATWKPERLFDIHRATVTISSRATELLALFATPPNQEEARERLFPIEHKLLVETFRDSPRPVIRVGLEGKNRDLFFGTIAHEIRSEALVPLYSRPDAGANSLIGSLNLGGQTPNRFLPSDSTDLLRDLADILGLCLARLSPMLA